MEARRAARSIAAAAGIALASLSCVGSYGRERLLPRPEPLPVHAGGSLSEDEQRRLADVRRFLGPYDQEVLERGVFEIVTGPGRIEQVACQHGVERQATQGDALTRQDQTVTLEIVPALCERLVFEERAESSEDQRPIQLRRCRRAGQEASTSCVSLVPDRDVAGPPVAGRHGDAHDVGPHG